MNKILLSGRAVAEPEIKFLTDGKAVCTFKLAVRRDFKNKNGEYESDFFSCVSFGKTGERIGEYVKKGDMFPIWGKSQNRMWEKDGVKHYVNEVMVEGFDFPPKQQSNNNTTGREGPTSSFGHEVNLDDDTPF